MITINKSRKKGELFVRAKSGRNILHSSETLKRKQSCFTNIKASMKLYAAIYSGEKPVIDEKGNKWFYNSETKKFTLNK